METSTQMIGKEEMGATPGSAANLIREVRVKPRRQFSAEDKIHIVLEGFRKEMPVSDYAGVERNFHRHIPARLRDTLRILQRRCCVWGSAINMLSSTVMERPPVNPNARGAPRIPAMAPEIRLPDGPSPRETSRRDITLPRT